MAPPPVLFFRKAPFLRLLPPFAGGIVVEDAWRLPPLVAWSCFGFAFLFLVGFSFLRLNGFWSRCGTGGEDVFRQLYYRGAP